MMMRAKMAQDIGQTFYLGWVSKLLIDGNTGSVQIAGPLTNSPSLVKTTTALSSFSPSPSPSFYDTHTHTGRYYIASVELSCPLNVESIKKLIGTENIKIAVINAEREIQRLMTLWCVAEQGSAQKLLKQRLVDVQAVAQMALNLPAAPSLDSLCRHVEDLGGLEGEKPVYGIWSASDVRWIHKQLSGCI
jgi:hypothetical protein